MDYSKFQYTIPQQQEGRGSRKLNDPISNFCKELSDRMTYYVIINRYNNYISDLTISFEELFYKTMRHLLPPVSVQDYCGASGRGPARRYSLSLISAILKQVSKIQEHLRKYKDNPPRLKHEISDVKFIDFIDDESDRSPKLHHQNPEIIPTDDFEFETDEESPRAFQRRIEHAEQQARRTQEKTEKRTRKYAEFEEQEQNRQSNELMEKIIHIANQNRDYHYDFRDWIGTQPAVAGLGFFRRFHKFLKYISKLVGKLPAEFVTNGRYPTRQYIHQWYAAKSLKNLHEKTQLMTTSKKDLEKYMRKMSKYTLLFDARTELNPKMSEKFESLKQWIKYEQDRILFFEQEIKTITSNIEKEADWLFSFIEQVYQPKNGMILVAVSQPDSRNSPSSSTQIPQIRAFSIFKDQASHQHLNRFREYIRSAHWGDVHGNGVDVTDFLKSFRFTKIQNLKDLFGAAGEYLHIEYSTSDVLFFNDSHNYKYQLLHTHQHGDPNYSTCINMKHNLSYPPDVFPSNYNLGGMHYLHQGLPGSRLTCDIYQGIYIETDDN